MDKNHSMICPVASFNYFCLIRVLWVLVARKPVSVSQAMLNSLYLLFLLNEKKSSCQRDIGHLNPDQYRWSQIKYLRRFQIYFQVSIYFPDFMFCPIHSNSKEGGDIVNTGKIQGEVRCDRSSFIKNRTG